MSNFISMVCPSCGGKLKISTNTTSLTCQHCGTEHMVKHEASGVMLEAYARCPQCGRNDKSEKVTAIISSQTHEVSGTEQKTDIIVNPQGKQQVVIREVPYTRKQISTLGQKLAPPTQLEFTPSTINKPSSSMIIGAITFGIFGLLMGAFGLVCIGYALFFTDIYGLLIPIVGAILLFLGAVIFIGGGILLGIYGRKKAQKDKIEYERQVQEANQERDRIQKAWQRSMERWNQLYYCTRDDCVFIPGDSSSAPIAKMMEYLYQ